jgi:hypothetical protein
MRIELPNPSWADTLHRAEDDAHTLTVATPPADWLPGTWGMEAAPALRATVPEVEPQVMTLTF